MYQPRDYIMAQDKLSSYTGSLIVLLEVNKFRGQKYLVYFVVRKSNFIAISCHRYLLYLCRKIKFISNVDL